MVTGKAGDRQRKMLYIMPNDIVWDIKRLYLAFVPIEKVFTDVGVLADWIRLPWHVGIAEQIGVHRILLQSLLYEVGAFAIFMQKPHFGYDQFSIEKDDIVSVSLRYPFGEGS